MINAEQNVQNLPNAQNGQEDGQNVRNEDSDTSSSCCSDFEFMSENEVILANEKDEKKLKVHMRHIIRFQTEQAELTLNNKKMKISTEEFTRASREEKRKRAKTHKKVLRKASKIM